MISSRNFLDNVDDGIDEFELRVILSGESDAEEDFISSNAAGAISDQELELPNNSSAEKTPFQIKIEKALEINKALEKHFKILDERILGKIAECELELLKLNTIMDETRIVSSYGRFTYFKCGIPYFKDQNQFPAPLNEDAVKMNKLGLLNYNNIRLHRWTVLQKNKFLHEILIESRNIRFKKLTSQINDLKRENPSEERKLRLIELEKLVSEVDGLSLEQVALPIDEEYDWDIISNRSNLKFSTKEIRNFWKVVLHPSINKKAWSNTERGKLKNLAVKYDFQDWDAIARDLDTKRSAFQCIAYYKMEIKRFVKGIQWSRSDDRQLLRIVDACRIGEYIPWGKVLYFIGDKTRRQIYNRYLRLQISRKGRFSPEEDKVLLACLNQYGEDSRRLCRCLPGRSKTQIQRRIGALLSSNGPWTVDEDRLLLRLLSGRTSLRNAPFSSLSKHFESKNRAQVRGRAVILFNWRSFNPKSNVDLAPRRTFKPPARKSVDSLEEALLELKKASRPPSDDKTTHDHDDDDNPAIEEELLAYFIFDRQNDTSVEKPPADVRNMSVILNVKLESQHSKTSIRQVRSNYLNPARRFIIQPMLKTYGKENTTKCIKLVENSSPKTYSKKDAVSLELPYKSERILFSSFDLLPPNFETLMALKRIMTYVYTFHSMYKNENAIFHPISSQFRNEALTLWKNRFESLLYWPVYFSIFKRSKYN